MSASFNFIQIQQSIDDSTKAVIRLEKRLDQLGKSSVALNRLFGSRANFTAFVDNVNKLNAQSSTNFRQVADGLTQLANAVRKLPQNNNVRSLTRGLSELAVTISTIKSTKTSNTNLAAFLDTIVITATKITQLSQTIPDTKALNRFVGSLAKIFTAFSSLKATKTSNANVGTFLQTLQLQIEQMIRTAASIQNANDLPKVFNSISTIFSSIARLANSLSKIPATSTIGVGNFIAPLISDLVRATYLVKDADSFKQLSETLKNAGKIVSYLNVFTKTLDSVKPGTNLTLQPIIDGLIKPLLNMNASARGLKDLNSLGGGLRNVSKGLEELRKFQDAIPPTLRNKPNGPLNYSFLSDSVTAIGKIGKAFAVETRNIAGLPELTKLSQGLSGIASGANSILKFGDQLPGDVGERLKRILRISAINSPLRTISYIGKNLGSTASNIKNLDSLATLGTGLRNLGSGVKAIIGLTEDIRGDIGTRLSRFLGLGKLPEVLRVIGFIATQLGNSAGKLKNLAGLSDLGTALSGIGDFLRSLNKLNLADIGNPGFLSRLPVVGKVFQGIGTLFGGATKFSQVAKVIKDLAKAFSGFKGINIPDFDKLLPTLISFASGASGIDFGKVNLKGFSSFTKELAGGLKNLSAIKVDTAKLTSLGATLQSLRGGLNFGGRGGSPAQAAGGFGATIIQNAVGQFLGQVAFSALAKVQDFIKRLIGFDSSIRNTLQNIGRSFSSFGTQMQTIGRTLNTNFGLEKLFNSGSTGVAADFDALSTQVQVFGDLTEEQLVKAQAFADEIGIRYPLSANDALKAILDLEKAGQDLSNIEFILPSAADLSALGDIDLSTATQSLIAAANAFEQFAPGVEGTFDNISTAADVISGAADKSTASVAELIAGIQDVGPTARDAGLSLQEVAAIIAQFNDAGIRGSEAGRSLKTILSTLVRPQTREELSFLQDTLQEISGTSFDLNFANADGSIKNLDELIRNLGATYEALNYSEAAVFDSTSKLTEQFGRVGLSVLLANNGYSELAEQIGNVGTAQERAQLLLNNFKGDVEQLKGSVETLTKNAFLPLIRNAFRPMIQLGRRVVDGILNLNNAMEQTGEGIFGVVSNVILLTSTLATLTGGLLLGVGAVLRFEGILFRIGAAVSTLVFRLPLVIAGIGSFAASFVVLTGVIATASAALVGVAVVFNEFRRVIEDNVGGAGDAFNSFRETVAHAVEIVGPTLGEIGKVIGLLFGATVQREIGGFGVRVAGFFDRLSAAALNLRRGLEQVGAGFEVFGNFVQAGFGGQTPRQIARIDEQLRRLATLPLIKQIFGNNATAAGLRRTFTFIQQGFERAGRAVEDILSGGIGVLFGEPRALGRVRRGVSLLGATISRVLSRVTGLDLTETILNFDEGNVEHGVISFFRTVLDTIKEFVANNKNLIGNVISGILTFPFDAAATILRILGLDNVANVVSTITNTVRNVLSQVFSGGIGLLLGGTQLANPFIDSLTDAISRADYGELIRILGQRTRDSIANAIRELPTLLRNIGVTLDLPALIGFADDLKESPFLDQIARALGSIATLPLTLVNRVINGITSLVGTINLSDPGNLIKVGAGMLAIAKAVGLLGVGKKILIFDTIANAIENLDMLVKGDVGGFIVTTISGVAADILAALGVENFPQETILSRAQVAFEYLRDNLPAVINDLATQVTDSINRFASGIFISISRVGAAADAAVNPGGGFGTAFKAADEALGGTGALSPEIFTTLANPNLADPALDAFATANAQRLVDAFAAELNDSGSVAAIPEALFDSIGKVLQNSGLLDRALAGISESDRNAFMARLLTGGVGSDAANAQAVLDAQQLETILAGIQKQFFDASIQGTAGRTYEDQASFLKTILEQNGFTNLSAEDEAAIFARLSQGMDYIAVRQLETIRNILRSRAEAAPPIPIGVDITVTADSIDITPALASLRTATNRAERSASIRNRLLGSGNLFNRAANANRSLYAPGLIGPVQDNPFFAEPRANGGSLKPYSVYGVHDTQSPEIAKLNDGTSLLFTGKVGGFMSRIVGMASAPITRGGSIGGNARQGVQTSQEARDLGITQATLEEIQAAREEHRKESKKETDQLAKDLEEVQKDVLKSQADFQQKQLDDLAKYQTDVKRAEEDFYHERGNIVNQGRDQLLEAIRSGNGAQAVAAVKNTRDQLKEQEYQFTTENQRRAEDFQVQQAQAERERLERAKEYDDRITEIITRGEEIVAAEETFTQELIDETTGRNRSLEDQNATSNAKIKQDAKTTSTYLLDIATANNGAIISTANTIRDAFASIGLSSTNLIFGLNSAAQQAAQAAQINPVTGVGFGSLQGIANLPQQASSSASQPIGAPRNPSNGQQFVDLSRQLWIYLGGQWRRGTAVPNNANTQGRAGGGSINQNSRYQVFDTDQPEIVNMNNGRSFLLTGKQSGNIVPESAMRQNGSDAGGTTVVNQFDVKIDIGGVSSPAANPMEVAELVVDLAVVKFEKIASKANAGRRSNSLLEVNRRGK